MDSVSTESVITSTQHQESQVLSIGHISENAQSLQKSFFNDLKDKGRSTNTLKTYKTDLDCFNQFLLLNKGDLSLNEFNLQHVASYDEYLQKKYDSDNSRRRRVQALRLFFDYLVEREIFSSNPVRKLPTSPKFLDIPRPTSFEEVTKLWDFLLKESNRTDLSTIEELVIRRNQILFLFIFSGGLKVSDLAHLKEEHVFLGNSPRVMILPKKRDPYSVPLPKIFTSVFERYYSLLKSCKMQSGLDFEEILFNANPYKILSGGLSPRGIETIMEEIRKKLGIRLTPKSLRQSCIFNWLSKKHPENLVKEWMGVAPSYSLKLYKEHLENNLYNDAFIEEFYLIHRSIQ
ncbi:MAG: site-specific integrase [Halobacteriovoraceae bacterium]|nr:site-specific integrase [Halobacteriovoraceae bacterium]